MLVLETVQVDSSLEIKILSLLTMIIGQEEIHIMVPRRHKECHPVTGVEVDESLQMGLSSQKSSCGLADGNEWGSGKHPKALKKFAFSSINFHHFCHFFNLENEHDWYIFVLHFSNPGQE